MLASTFAVSHNVPETKPLQAGAAQDSLAQNPGPRDWGVQQVVTSADWGGVVGNFFTGGLNLQARLFEASPARQIGSACPGLFGSGLDGCPAAEHS